MAEAKDDQTDRDQSGPDTDAEIVTTPKTASVQGKMCGPKRRSTVGGWTAEQDEKLVVAVKENGAKNWKSVAKCVPGRTDVQCLHRWQKVLDPNLYKGPWRKEEDDILIELVQKQGNRKWSKIAKHLPGRMGKQCRERWHNHLNPEINKSAWTREEEVILVEAQREHGNKWAEIAKILPGRTENMIKNHWNSSVKKRAELLSGSSSASASASASASSFCSQSVVEPENQRFEQTKETPETKEDMERDALDLTLRISSWAGTHLFTSSSREEEASSSGESDHLGFNKTNQLHQTSLNDCVTFPMSHESFLQLSSSNSTTPVTPVSNDLQETSPETNGDIHAYLRKFRDFCRTAASTYENTPSIISRSSSPAFKRHRSDRTSSEMISLQNSDDRNTVSSVEERSASASKSPRLEVSDTKPLERRLEYEFL